MMQRYLLTLAPGLASVVAAETAAGLGVAARPVARVRNYELAELGYGGAVRELGRLRTAEDVFVELGRVKLGGSLADIRALGTAALWGGALRRGLELWSQATGRPLVKRLVWRVVVQADDVRWRQYRRQELTLAVERALVSAGASWRINRDEAPLELWCWQVGHELVVGLRLTDNDSRQHDGREVEREAALRPSIAAAMVRLSRPEADDVFLDPMCGSGTILLERAVMGRYELLLGGDSDAGAVAATLANFGPRHQPRRIERWDARALPLEEASVTQLVCNLPWGRLIGEKAQIPALYRALMAEFSRVVVPGGRLVLLTSEGADLKAALAHSPALRLAQTVPGVEVLGRRADIFVLERR